MGEYDDILYLPHHRSRKRSQMTMQDRAAQFSPFAALTGFDDAIEETGRLTDRRPELVEYGNAQLDRVLHQLIELLPQHPMVSITCFVPDDRKAGGAYETIEGNVQKIDLYRRRLTLTGGREVLLGDILYMETPQITDIIWL